MDNQKPIPNPAVQETPSSQVYTAPHIDNPPPKKPFFTGRIISLIVILLILFGAGGTYLALNSKPKSQPSPQPQPTTTFQSTSTPTPAVQSTPTPDETANSAIDKILLINWHGGFCSDDGECSSTITLKKDGSVVPETETTKKLDSQTVNRVQNLISSTDFEKIKAKKFTGTCPTAYDGSEVIYTFYTKRGIEVLPSCKYFIDYNVPLFNFIQKFF